ncbi:MAG TPA: hypothetical protein VGW78_02660 [Candidatus Babeliales bacterium]|jgi:hypothetical protein|nr:hypothetical protein [Candidatus Babeliales bacterium]
MKKYILYVMLSFSSIIYAIETKYIDAMAQMYKDIDEFINNVCNKPLAENKNPFIDPTKPENMQNQWCTECSMLFSYANHDEIEEYGIVCKRPLMDTWTNTSLETVQNNPSFKGISQNNIPIPLQLLDYFPHLVKRFEKIGIIKRKNNRNL